MRRKLGIEGASGERERGRIARPGRFSLAHRMARLVVRGKYIFDGAKKFYARGVSYGPFAENSHGERYPEPERAETDFALMRQLGANVIRVYVPPPAWMFELAAKYELRMMVGMPWPFHMAFLDSKEMTREIRETIRQGVSTMRQ